MNKNDTLRNLLIAAAIFYVIVFFSSRWLPQTAPSPTPPGEMPTGGTVDRAPAVPADGLPSEVRPKPPSATSAGAGSFVVKEAAEVRTLNLGATPDDWTTQDPRRGSYRSALTLTNVGAAIERAFMADHAEKLKQPDRYQLLAPVTSTDGTVWHSLAVERINIDGQDLPLADKRWHASDVRPYSPVGNDPSSESGLLAAFTLEIEKENRPNLRLRRTYRLPQQPETLHRHDLYVGLEIENLSAAPHQVIVSYLGGVGVPHSDPRSDDRFVDYGVTASESVVVGARKAFLNLIGKPGMQELFRPSPADPLQRFVWAATGNNFFTCTLAPLAADGAVHAPHIAEVVAYDRDALPQTNDDILVRFVTAPASIAPSQTASFPVEVYLGEKEFDGFRKVEPYVRRNYYVQISASYGSCTFSWLVEMMIWLLNGLHFVVRDFGVAIIILVLIVRSLLHPITKKGQVNMVRMQHRMQELAPKIEEIKKKYANDRARLNQEMMKLNLNPAGQLLTCLPMFIQMPIWIALWISLSNNILMRHEPFLFTWIRDLSAADALIPFSAPLTVPLFGWKIAAFNLLPILVSIMQYVQIKTQPKPKPSPNMTEEQKRQQEMMQSMTPMMCIMMLLIFYNAPSGLNLYVMASSFFGAIEQWLIRRHIKEREASGTLHQSAPQRPSPATVSSEPLKPSLPGWLQKLQKMAGDAQKLQSQRPAKGKKK